MAERWIVEKSPVAFAVYEDGFVIATAVNRENAQRVMDAFEQRDKLRAFAQEVIDAPGDGLDLDGGDLQALAVAHKLLTPETRTEPCGSVNSRADHTQCNCEQFGFPAECYRKTPLLTGGENG